MKILVNKPGTRIRKSKDCISIQYPDEKKKKYIPFSKIESITFLDSSSVSSDVMCKLAEKGAPIIFCTRNGWPRAEVIAFNSSKHVVLRKKQLKLTQQLRSLDIIKEILYAKILSQSRILASLNFFDISETLHQKAINIRTIKGNNLAILKEKMRGLEGSASSLYFQSLASIFPKEFNFKGRTFNPPLDPINALFSYGYGFLYSKIWAFCAQHGLDYYAGFFHGDKYNRKSLVYDLSEEFKPFFIDKTIINLILKNSFDIKKDFSFEKHAVFLNENGRRKLISTLLSKLLRRHMYNGKKEMLERIIEFQISKFSKVIMSDNKKYIPFTSWD